MKNKNFMILIFGQIISLFGSAIQRFSLSLYLLDKTNSAGTFANILAISMIPYVVCAPIAGILADRKKKKHVMVWLDFGSFLVTGIYFLFLNANKDTASMAGAVMFLLAVAYTLYAPSVTASIPLLVKDDELLRANGIVSQIGSMANFLGPVLAGALYAFFGIRIIVLVNAISFFISAIMELFLTIPGDRNHKMEGGLLKQSIVDMKETYDYLRKEKKGVLRTIASFGMSNVGFSPAFSVVMPFVLNTALGINSTIYGVVEGVIVIGMITGGFILTIKPKLFTMKRLHLFLAPMAVFFFSMAMSSIGLDHLSTGRTVAVVVCYMVAGFGVFLLLGVTNIITATYIQQAIPSDKLGKVSAFSTAVATISVAPGQLLYGQLIEGGISIAIVLMITTILNLAVTFFVSRTVKYHI